MQERRARKRRAREKEGEHAREQRRLGLHRPLLKLWLFERRVLCTTLG